MEGLATVTKIETVEYSS